MRAASFAHCILRRGTCKPTLSEPTDAKLPALVDWPKLPRKLPVDPLCLIPAAKLPVKGEGPCHALMSPEACAGALVLGGSALGPRPCCIKPIMSKYTPPTRCSHAATAQPEKRGPKAHKRRGTRRSRATKGQVADLRLHLTCCRPRCRGEHSRRPSSSVARGRGSV